MPKPKSTSNTHRFNRRQFLQTAAAVGAGYWVASPRPLFAQATTANEKLNIAVIGCGGMGSGHVARSARENLVAMCDVDEARAGDNFAKHPKARKFNDFRVMFDQMHKEIDAVFVATPDHVHAAATAAALRLGKAVYCQKPLTHTVHEARVLAKLAAEQKVATQMGNQGHSSRGSRQIVEAIRSGVIGRVKEAHGWCPKGFSAKIRPAETMPIPETLKTWDLWLGPAPERPYNKAYLPFNWRGWADFGTGGLGDMACHILDPIFWALDLRYPTAVESQSENTAGEHPEGYPPNLTVKYDFAARGDAVHQQGPVTVYWHHGSHIPGRKPIAGLEFPTEELKKRSNGEACAFVGEKGVLIADRGPGILAVLPLEQFKDFKTPEVGKLSGHEDEWITACKEKTPTGSNFDYAAKLTETVLLGNVAWRVGKRLEWDAANMRATNAPEADAYLRREYRKGWSL